MLVSSSNDTRPILLSCFYNPPLSPLLTLHLTFPSSSLPLLPPPYPSSSHPPPLTPIPSQVILMNMLNVAQVTVTKTILLSTVSWQVTFAEVAQVPLFTVHSSNFYCSGAPYTPTITYAQSFNATSKAMASAAYTWQLVPSLGYQAGGSYLLTNLLPGATYYARVSAVTRRGTGARRLAAPNAFTVPITPPSAPTQREGSWGLPRLFLSSPTSLTVRIGPPTFDGGSLAAQVATTPPPSLHPAATKLT